MPQSTLTEDKVLEIKRRLWMGESSAAVALAFDISHDSVRGIRSGARWANVPWPQEHPEDQLVTGAMPAKRQREILEARRAAATELYKVVKRKLKQ